MDQIVVLLRYINQEDNSELFVNKNSFEESISLQNFFDEISEILEIMNSAIEYNTRKIHKIKT